MRLRSGARRGRGNWCFIGWALALTVLARPQATAAGDAGGATPPGRPAIAVVLPFANGTGDPKLDWIGIALQDAINVDLWYVGTLYTWDLPNMVGQAQEPPLSMAVDDPTGVAKLAARFGADLLFSGRYRTAGDKITLVTRLSRASAGGGQPEERSGTAPLASLTELASKLVLELLDAAKIAVGVEERARILIAKTRSVDALRDNANGFEPYVRYSLKHDDRLLQEALKQFETAVKVDPAYAEAWNNLGWAQFVAKDYANAVSSFERAVSLRVDLIDALVGLGKTKGAATPDDASALPPVEAAVRLNPSLGGHRLELAEVLEMLGQQPRSMQELEAAQRIVAGRIPYMEGNIHLRAAGLLVRKGDLDAAADRLGQARGVYQASGNKAGEAGTLRALGDLSTTRRDFVAARRHYTEALALVKQLGDRRAEGMLHNALGMAALNGGDGPAAERYFDEGLQVARDGGDKSGQMLLLFNLGLLVAARGDLERAQGHLVEALLLARQVGDRDAEEAIQQRLRQIRDALGNRDAT